MISEVYTIMLLNSSLSKKKNVKLEIEFETAKIHTGFINQN